MLTMLKHKKDWQIAKCQPCPLIIIKNQPLSWPLKTAASICKPFAQDSMNVILCCFSLLHIHVVTLAVMYNSHICIASIF